MSETFTFKEGREQSFDYELSVQFGAEYDGLSVPDKLNLIEDCSSLLEETGDDGEYLYSTAESAAREYRARIGGGDNIASYARCFQYD